jgi:hypothetical protein
MTKEQEVKIITQLASEPSYFSTCLVNDDLQIMLQNISNDHPLFMGTSIDPYIAEKLQSDVNELNQKLNDANQMIGSIETERDNFKNVLENEREIKNEQIADLKNTISSLYDTQEQDKRMIHVYRNFIAQLMMESPVMFLKTDARILLGMVTLPADEVRFVEDQYSSNFHYERPVEVDDEDRR